jgi:bacillithiol system protein YtxJ
MNWINLNEMSDLDLITTKSQAIPVVIFKHSTRCSISSAAKSRLERGWTDNESKLADMYYLDLIKNRNISNEVAQRFGVEHESPQILVISEGKCIYHESHSMIIADDLKEVIRGNM